VRTKLIVGGLVGLAAVAGAFVLKKNPAQTGTSSAGVPPAALPVVDLAAAAAPGPSVTRCAIGPGVRVSYAYQSVVDSSISMQGMPQPMQHRTKADATLALEGLSRAGDDSVVLAQLIALSEEFVKMHGPKLGAPFLLKIGSGCDIKQFARAKATGLRTAQAQQVAMFDLFFKVPASQPEVVSYENGVGLAKAVFSNIGGAVTRRVTGYEFAWRIKGTFEVKTSNARVTLNDHWVETFESVEGISGGLLLGAKSTVSLVREQGESTEVSGSASRKVTDYEWTNLLSGTFVSDAVTGVAANVPLAEQRYVEMMKNETMESSFATLLERVVQKANIEDQWHEMAGFLNGHPEQIEGFAEGLKAQDFPAEAKAVSYLVLSKVAHPEAREALSALRRDTTLERGDRVRASLALVTRKDVGAELAREMRKDALVVSTGDAEADFVPRNTLLHLGVLGGLHKADQEAVAVVRDAVKTQLRAAGDDTYALSPALAAVGNASDPSLLSSIEGYTRHLNPDVRALAPKALRGYSYAATEALWVDWLARETSPDVKEVIFDTLYHQLADAQRKAGPAIAFEAMRHLRMKPLVLARQSIIHILGPLKSENPEARKLLIEQLGVEFRNNSGLYSQIANHLAPAEVELGLAMMPEFAHQYGARGQAAAADAVRRNDAKEAADPAKHWTIEGAE